MTVVESGAWLERRRNVSPVGMENRGGRKGGDGAVD